MKKKLVVLTGAGMSVESGLSTFRDSGGLWDRYPVEDVATPEGWEHNPALVQGFYNKRRKELLTVEPNAGHKGLAELEKEYDVTIITQNVDNLHERAGSTHVLHLHGELTKVRSVKDESRVYELTPDQYELAPDATDSHGDRLRPHIVWFGEAVPMIEPAIRITEEADIFVVIGTSLNVYPAAGLLAYVRPQVPIYLIDPKEVRVPINRPVHVIQKGASEGVAELIEDLRHEA
ncbi:MAG TPA: NAD-dependent deacylase [Candidatus Barnesiella merdigallinarum]|nr:NAD-dependent deacylase [Candidatus Barnesiella merdigallinarum]